MKDHNDNATTELFPIPKKRGRPSTGKANTNAQRQTAYRERKAQGSDLHQFGQKNLNIWLDKNVIWHLERLAKYHSKTVPDMLSQIIQQADSEVKELIAKTQGNDAYFDYIEYK